MSGAPRARNVLVLLSDEHQAAAMGCAGHPIVRTPSLDALAARGARFTRAWTPSPVCVPARASLATGRWVHDIGYWDNATAYDGRVPGWGHRLQAAGVAVESIGKLHYRDADAPTGLDAQHMPTHVWRGIGQVWGSVRDPMPETMGRSPLYDELGEGESDYNRHDLQVADRAVRWLHERRDDARPWVLFVGLVAPHFPLVVPRRWLDAYPPDAMPLPRLRPATGYRRHPWVERQARHMDHDAAIGTDARRRLAIASYFALTSFMDAQVGRVLEALRDAGHERDTAVVYSSDHGDNLGERGMWNKCLLYRESTAVPMIVAGPGVPRGAVCDTDVSLVDVAPTLYDVLGLPDDPSLPGASLRRIAAAPHDPLRTGFAEYHAVGAASAAYLLARGRYTYHHYVGYPPELFDLHADPLQHADLSGDPAQAPVLEAFERLLRARLDPEAVDRRAKDDQNRLVARFGGRDGALRSGTPGATPVLESEP